MHNFQQKVFIFGLLTCIIIDYMWYVSNKTMVKPIFWYEHSTYIREIVT